MPFDPGKSVGEHPTNLRNLDTALIKAIQKHVQDMMALLPGDELIAFKEIMNQPRYLSSIVVKIEPEDLVRGVLKPLFQGLSQVLHSMRLANAGFSKEGQAGLCCYALERHDIRPRPFGILAFRINQEPPVREVSLCPHVGTKTVSMGM